MRARDGVSCRIAEKTCSWMQKKREAGGAGEW